MGRLDSMGIGCGRMTEPERARLAVIAS